MTQLYIGNLPDDCSEDFLRDRFEKHGKIKEVRTFELDGILSFPTTDNYSLVGKKCIINSLKST